MAKTIGMATCPKPGVHSRVVAFFQRRTIEEHYRRLATRYRTDFSVDDVEDWLSDEENELSAHQSHLEGARAPAGGLAKLRGQYLAVAEMARANCPARV